MSQATIARFDGYDLKDELRPPELCDDAQRRVRDGASDDRGLLPRPVLDRQHGEVCVVSDRVVQVFTDEDIYHELVEWLDEVFEVPVSYTVHWNAMDISHGNSEIEPHALILLGVDDTTRTFDVGESGPTFRHDYKRGDYAGEANHLIVTPDGRLQVSAGEPTIASSLSEAAEIADQQTRGEDARSVGFNGWTWWEVPGTDVTLDDLR